MDKVWEGDSWKRADDKPKVVHQLTRHEAQVQADDDFAYDRIGLAEWRMRTSELSNMDLWAKDGKLAT